MNAFAHTVCNEIGRKSRAAEKLQLDSSYVMLFINFIWKYLSGTFMGFCSLFLLLLETSWIQVGYGFCHISHIHTPQPRALHCKTSTGMCFISAKWQIRYLNLNGISIISTALHCRYNSSGPFHTSYNIPFKANFVWKNAAHFKMMKIAFIRCMRASLNFILYTFALISFERNSFIQKCCNYITNSEGNKFLLKSFFVVFSILENWYIVLTIWLQIAIELANKKQNVCLAKEMRLHFIMLPFHFIQD